VARAAWALGRGIEPLLSFSEGRTFRTAVRLQRHPAAREEEQLGLLAHCHRCGEQQLQSLLRLRGWQACACEASGGEGAGLAISGPLWIGPLQHPATLAALLADAASLAAAGQDSLAPAARRLLQRLAADDGLPARCWPLAEIGRRLGQGPPPLQALLAALRAGGFQAQASGVMAGQVRSDAPWPQLLALAAAGSAAR
jgi:tRNA (guanine26-N2/guanine27-N2)-dimethyltransferase